jgi:predicted transport protein
MGLEPEEQRHLYETYWHLMEQEFGQSHYAKYFDWFMRDYLTLKHESGAIPTVVMIYEAFKKYVNQNTVPIEDIVIDIHKYSKHYTNLLMQNGDEPDIIEVLTDISILKVEVSFPLLLEVLNDYQEGILEKSDLIKILRMIESYVFRRAICGIPTNSLNKTFATFTRSKVDKNNYLESFTAKLLLLDSYRRFPSNEEFTQSLLTRDVYNFRNRNYLLRKLENFDRKEKVQVDNYTIEHIMPQNENLSAEWRHDLGNDWQSVQERYLHTIGNLSLTGYNSELSDRPFLEKRNMKGGFADSPIRLNKSLADLQVWNEESIINRTTTLGKQAIKIWTIPELTGDVLAQYRIEPEKKRKAVYSIEDHAGYLQGEMLELFQLLRRRILYIDPTVKEEFKKLYIAYKTTTNFVDIIPQKSRLRLSLNINFDEINDPQGICKDVTNLGRWGNGDVEVGFKSSTEIDYVMFLIQQSFDVHSEDI